MCARVVRNGIFKVMLNSELGKRNPSVQLIRKAGRPAKAFVRYRYLFIAKHEARAPDRMGGNLARRSLFVHLRASEGSLARCGPNFTAPRGTAMGADVRCYTAPSSVRIMQRSKILSRPLCNERIAKTWVWDH